MSHPAAGSAPAPLTDVAFPKLLGAPGLAQGRYGERGNFELVAPDPDDGLWVFWHNNDLPVPGAATVPGPPPGRWSGGLHFARGHRFDSVCVLQSRNGPDHLELLARESTVVHRFRWSPAPAFTHEGELPVRAGGAPALAETPDGTLHALVPLPDGGATWLTARPDTYPALDWQRRQPRPFAEAERVLTAAAGTGGPYTDSPVGVLGTADGRLLLCAADGPSARPLPGEATAGHVATLADDDGVRCFTTGPGPVLRVSSSTGRSWPDVPLPGSGAVGGIAVTWASFDRHRTDVAVQRGHEILHLTRTAGPDGAWQVTTARSRVLPGPGIPPGVHRRS
ncbi:hypothetical protein [Streptomyces sp. 184]|uniref:hypothetical protein n=1 Tax=Streptomyces sp. 184 TaxID=1827526 RepID=UPI0038925B9F